LAKNFYATAVALGIDVEILFERQRAKRLEQKARPRLFAG